MSNINKSDITTLIIVGKQLQKDWEKYKKSEMKLAKELKPFIEKLIILKDVAGLLFLVNNVPTCSTNGQFIYKAIYEIQNPKK